MYAKSPENVVFSDVFPWWYQHGVISFNEFKQVFGYVLLILCNTMFSSYIFICGNVAVKLFIADMYY